MEANILVKLSSGHPLKQLIEDAKKSYGSINTAKLVFCIDRPLTLDDNDNYTSKSGVAILSPDHKIIFLGFENDKELDNFREDFLSDIDTLSNKFNYQRYIRRSRIWANELTSTITVPENIEEIDLDEYIGSGQYEVNEDNKRLIKYVISLVTGSINDIDEDSLGKPQNILEEIRNKIILFDADQTRFLYTDYKVKKLVSVQGLSGTGKTELLLHKLADIYSKTDVSEVKRVFFTCHNIALSNEISNRIKPFFDRMRVARQIQLNEELFVGHAWGSRNNPTSGLYTFLCRHYEQQFLPYVHGRTYETIFSQLLEGLNQIPNKAFQPCFDYILVDESQDFPEVFFDVCKKVVKEKVYSAGDVFQNIFDTHQNKPKGFNISLNRCYRTDPRTLMFAHVLGLGLKENQRYNWFDDKGWEAIGYKVSRNRKQNTIDLKRFPIDRFGGDEPKNSVEILQGTTTAEICNILKTIKKGNPTVKPGDIAIILIDDDKEIYDYMDKLSIKITKDLDWTVRRGYEIKQTSPDCLYLTNANNVKGLEFPFVICITGALRNTIRYRNTLYTMLTRSFLVTYLVFKHETNLVDVKQIYNDINKTRYIAQITVPTADEIKAIAHPLIEEVDKLKTFGDIMDEIVEKYNLNNSKRAVLEKMIAASTINKSEPKMIEKFVKSNIDFL